MINFREERGRNLRRKKNGEAINKIKQNHSNLKSKLLFDQPNETKATLFAWCLVFNLRKLFLHHFRLSLSLFLQSLNYFFFTLVQESLPSRTNKRNYNKRIGFNSRPNGMGAMGFFVWLVRPIKTNTANDNRNIHNTKRIFLIAFHLSLRKRKLFCIQMIHSNWLISSK